MSSMSPVSRPMILGASELSMASTTVETREASVAEPMPYRPGWSVRTLTMTHVPAARVRMGVTAVMRAMVWSLGCCCS